VPEIFNWPKGCAFADRCAYVKDSCKQGLPPIELVPQRVHFNESKDKDEGEETDKPRHLAEHWVRCPEWQKLEAAA
jgi:ABC-type dipeptide/oligopeptide/nickel transport system ATPase component